ncbi:cation:proton antiporter [Corynebacterium atypicum]|uniref:Cation:proton antiporter n=1 Tax=Corynebacterium atypicum TaxID=191610 RepID=A0ABN4DGL1_9CORY|nr:Na+/H+ antiporter subunit E [Corynebacterium atypicum]AIG64702.1 cation:proton antiporter [Corynebacterium atypicum]
MYSGVRNRFRPITIILFTLMWCLLMGEFTWANVIGGLLIGLAVVLLLPLPKLPVSNISMNWPAAFGFILRWFKELVQASITVAWLAIRPKDPPKTAVVQVPMRVANELVLTLATAAYNLQPGGSVSDIDIANRQWTVHLLNADNEELLAQEIEKVAQLERDMIRIFERS